MILLLLLAVCALVAVTGRADVGLVLVFVVIFLWVASTTGPRFP